MIENKIIIGLAKTDDKYGLDKTSKFLNILSHLSATNINHIDTAPTYSKSAEFVSKIPNRNKIKIYTKLPFISSDKKNSLEQKILDNINFQFK